MSGVLVWAMLTVSINGDVVVLVNNLSSEAECQKIVATYKAAVATPGNTRITTPKHPLCVQMKG